MTPIIWTYIAYLVAGVAVTCWVARTQRAHGSTFSRKSTRYDEETGPAMCHLLIVGFCLVSFGIVSLALGMGANVTTVESCIETISTKLGWVVLLIGVLHFVMLSIFAGMADIFSQSSLKDNKPTPAHSVTELTARGTPRF